MNTCTRLIAVIGLMIFGLRSAKADVFVIIKYNTAATWTRYQADDLQKTDGSGIARPYKHKAVSGSDSWSRYEIVNLTAGTTRSVDYWTFYDRGIAIKRYGFEPSDQSGYGAASLVSYSRAGGTNASPTYQWHNEFSNSSGSGGPEDATNPSTQLFRYESLYYVTAGPLALTTVIPATTAPVAPAIKALVPIRAAGVDNSYDFHAIYPSNAPGTLPDSITVEFSSGSPTVNYDSVLSANANKAAPVATTLIDYDGTVLSPRSMGYAIKLVRDALELLGYEKQETTGY